MSSQTGASNASNSKQFHETLEQHTTMKDMRSPAMHGAWNKSHSEHHPDGQATVIDSWRKERNQELIRAAYAFSAFASQSKVTLAKSRQAWLEQRAKYESHVLYEARRQLALLQHDSQRKGSAGSADSQPATTIAVTTSTLEWQPSIQASSKLGVSTDNQKHPGHGHSRDPDRLAQATSSGSPLSEATQPETSPPAKDDSLDGLGKSIARIEELMKKYTKPLTGSLSVSSPARTHSSATANQRNMPLNVSGAFRKPTTIERQHSDGPHFSGGSGLSGPNQSAQQGTPAKTTRSHGWDLKQDSLVSNEEGPGGAVAGERREPLASTWTDLGELGSHDLISLAAAHRSR